MEDRTTMVKAIYVYAVSLISLFVLLMGTGTLLYNALEHYVFPEADNYRYAYDICTTPKYTGTGEVIPTQEEIETCEQRVEKSEEKNQIARFQGAMLSGTVMVLVSLPIYLVHFFYLRRKL